jgi:dTDP-glucose pyrophosphorylase
MINIVVPMAGRGSRFAKAGYELPKPLISVHGRPMIEYVAKNIAPKQEHRFIFICLQEHLDEYDLENQLNQIAPGCTVVPVNHVTEGAACTVLLAEKYIDNENPMMIANSDQFVDIDINDYLSAIKDYDGLIMTMTADDPKWSFIQFNQNGFVTLLREKEVISNEATVGIYNYQHGSDFVKYAKQMIARDIRVNNEYYVAPVYNEMVEDGKKIVYYNVGSEDHGMYGLGIPEDLSKFLKNPLSMQVF